MLYEFDLCRGWRLEIRLVIRNFILMRPTLNKNPGHEGLGEFPWLAVHAVCFHRLLLGE